MAKRRTALAHMVEMNAVGEHDRLLATFDTGGEVEAPISGCQLHDPFERREAGLFWLFSVEPVGELHQIHRYCDSDMSQMRFAKANVT